MPRRKIFGSIMLFILILLLMVSQISVAQDENSCEVLLSQAVQTVQEVCSGLEPGNACTPSGDTIPLGDVERLQTTALNWGTNQWESALIKVPTDGQPISMALFGGAEIVYTSEVAEMPASKPLQVSNKSGYNVNLRQGPGKDFELAGFFGWDNVAPVDGRSADGEWLRLQTETGFAWIASDLVFVEGDVNSLPVLSGDVLPMPQFTLNTPENQAACGGNAGLLISHVGNEDVSLQVNGASLTFDDTTLLLQAQPNAKLDIYVIDGKTNVNANGQQITANQGETAEVMLAGPDGLEANASPLVKPSFPLTTLIGIPFELVSNETIGCTVGLIDSGANVSAFEQPDSGAAVTHLLLADAHYSVLGWTEDGEGNRWWLLEESWVRQDSVQVAGECDAVAEVDVNTSLTTTTNNIAVNNDAAASLFSTSLVPTSDTIWSADPGQDILSGTCVTPQLPVCPLPVVISPNGATLTWRGQEPLPYTLRLTGDNAYTFTGRNNLNNADISISLTFTSLMNWTMTMTHVFDNDPACVHTLYYNAVPR